MQTVKSIDKCHTGFVTKTELDDIIKLLAPSVKNRDLNLIYRPFCAVQNRILVEYKKFFEWLLTSLKQLDDDYLDVLRDINNSGKKDSSHKRDHSLSQDRV